MDGRPWVLSEARRAELRTNLNRAQRGPRRGGSMGEAERDNDPVNRCPAEREGRMPDLDWIEELDAKQYSPE